MENKNSGNYERELGQEIIPVQKIILQQIGAMGICAFA